MTMITTIGLDIAKSSFAVHCADAAGKTVRKVQLKRSQVLGFFAGVARCRAGRGIDTVDARLGLCLQALLHLGAEVTHHGMSLEL